MLSLKSLQQFLLPPLTFFPPQFLGWYWLTAATLRMSVVRRPTRSLLRVFLFPPLCSSILKPHLKQTTRRACAINDESSNLFLRVSKFAYIFTVNQTPPFPTFPFFFNLNKNVWIQNYRRRSNVCLLLLDEGPTTPEGVLIHQEH